jgi:signal transduction histidine kinase/CheY-like chemotaxis protein
MGLSAARNTAFHDLTESAARHAKTCEMNLMTTAKVAHGLADYVIIERPNSVEQITTFLRRKLETNPNITRCVIAFEPDAFPDLPRKSNDGYLSPFVYRSPETIDGHQDENFLYKDLAAEQKLTDLEWYTKPQKTHQPSWEEPHFSHHAGGILICSFSVPFFIDGKFSGVASIGISLGDIRNTITNISADDADYLLFSAAGTIIVSTDHPEWEMNETYNTVGDKYGAETLRGAAKKLLHGESGIYLVNSKITKMRIFGAYTPLPDIGWGLLKRIHEADVLRPVYAQLAASSITFAVGLCVIVVVILFSARNITQPLKQLLHFTRILSEGNWDVEVTGIKSRDEIEELAQTFATMAEKLRVSIDETVHTAAAKEAAETASMVKSQFLATMSHEMRTPLNGVIGIADLLRQTPLQPKQSEYVKLIKVSGESLLFLINDVLDFSKMEAGKFELNPTVFDLHKLLDTVISILAARVVEKQLELVATFGYNVPKHIYGDEGRLRQVLLNLVGNALKFTDKGGIRINVGLVEEESQNHIFFEVIDTGIGIPADRQEYLFQLFSQVDSSSSRKYGGTGLGLAISKRLVELMGGSIHVKSEEGKGSTFRFDVVLEIKPDDEVEHASAILTMTETIKKINGKPVLIVSNSIFQQPVLAEQFASWNFNPQVTASAQDALDKLRNAATSGSPFEQVIVDTHLADSEGEDLINTIQKDARLLHTPIIFLTPLADMSYRKTWEHPETLQFVSKPVQSIILFNAASRMFAGKETATASGSPRQEDGTLKNLRILVAEDNRINQIVIAEILKNADIEYVLAANGEEAVEKVTHEYFNAVLMDCQMPVMDGFAASRRIREWEAETKSRRIPIIALTANVTVEDEAKCLAVGMDAFCPKPVESKRVLALLKQWTKG